MSEIDIRKRLLLQVEAERRSKAILYVTGNRQGMETMIGRDVIDLFVDHLDAIGSVEKISLILHVSGGNVSAAWSLVNLLSMSCEDLEVITPSQCMSAGTLIALGAKRILMTKQATLGPIDPSIQHPLAPSIHGANPDARARVSVEAVNGYLEAIRGCDYDKSLEGKALLDLSNQVHPLVLGEIFRSRNQIRYLAEKLLARHISSSKDIERIVEFLCSESGSHDHTINRREADSLGLRVEKCTKGMYELLRKMYDSYSSQMQTRIPFDISTLAVSGQVITYDCIRAMIESPSIGGHHFISSGEIETTEQTGPAGRQIAIQDRRKFDGWRETT